MIFAISARSGMTEKDGCRDDTGNIGMLLTPAAVEYDMSTMTLITKMRMIHDDKSKSLYFFSIV